MSSEWLTCISVFIITYLEHWLFQKSLMTEMWRESGPSKVRMLGDWNWTCSVSLIVYFCWMLPGPVCLWWICFPDQLIIWGMDRNLGRDIDHKLCAFFHPWCHYCEKLWPLEVHSCLRPQERVKEVYLVNIKDSPWAAPLTSPLDLSAWLLPADWWKVSC